MVGEHPEAVEELYRLLTPRDRVEDRPEPDGFVDVEGQRKSTAALPVVEFR